MLTVLRFCKSTLLLVPSCKFSALFKSEGSGVSCVQVRELIYREILEYHPQMLADYLAGGHRQPNFVYPSAGASRGQGRGCVGMWLTARVQVLVGVWSSQACREGEGFVQVRIDILAGELCCATKADRVGPIAASCSIFLDTAPLTSPAFHLLLAPQWTTSNASLRTWRVAARGRRRTWGRPRRCRASACASSSPRRPSTCSARSTCRVRVLVCVCAWQVAQGCTRMEAGSTAGHRAHALLHLGGRIGCHRANQGKARAVTHLPVCGCCVLCAGVAGAAAYPMYGAPVDMDTGPAAIEQVGPLQHPPSARPRLPRLHLLCSLLPAAFWLAVYATLP